MKYAVSVDMVTSIVLTLKCLSALYRRSSGDIADLKYFWEVLRKVASAHFLPIPHLLASTSAWVFVYLLAFRLSPRGVGASGKSSIVNAAIL